MQPRSTRMSMSASVHDLRAICASSRRADSCSLAGDKLNTVPEPSEMMTTFGPSAVGSRCGSCARGRQKPFSHCCRALAVRCHTHQPKKSLLPLVQSDVPRRAEVKTVELLHSCQQPPDCRRNFRRIKVRPVSPPATTESPASQRKHRLLVGFAPNICVPSPCPSSLCWRRQGLSDARLARRNLLLEPLETAGHPQHIRRRSAIIWKVAQLDLVNLRIPSQ